MGIALEPLILEGNIHQQDIRWDWKQGLGKKSQQGKRRV
jgi:hypothetical protein